MKPSCQWSTKWSCLRTWGEGKALWGGFCFSKQRIKPKPPKPVPFFVFCLPPWRESSGLCFALLWLLTFGRAEIPTTAFGSLHSPGYSIVMWWDLSRPADLSPHKSWHCFSCWSCSGMKAMLNINVHTYFPQPASATVKGEGSGEKKQPSSMFAIPNLKYLPC